MVKKFNDTFSRFDTIPACDGHGTDRRTSCDSIVRATHTHRAVEIELEKSSRPQWAGRRLLTPPTEY